MTEPEALATLAGLIAETNRQLNLICRRHGFDTQARLIATLEQKALDLQGWLEGEAGMYEARQMVDPWDAA